MRKYQNTGPKIVPVVIIQQETKQPENKEVQKFDLVPFEELIQHSKQNFIVQPQKMIISNLQTPLLSPSFSNPPFLKSNPLPFFSDTKKRKFDHNFHQETGYLQKYNRLIRCKKDHSHTNLVENGKRHFFCLDCKTPKTVVEYTCTFCFENTKLFDWKNIKTVQVHQTYECKYYPKRKSREEVAK